MDKYIFENERYAVFVTDFQEPVTSHGASYHKGYAVLNKEHRIVEVFTPAYPDAVAAAEQLDIAIQNSVWKWIRINSEADELASMAAPDSEVQH